MKSMTSIFICVALVLLSISVFAPANGTVVATQNHNLHSSTSTTYQETMHEHARNCAAACGVEDRNQRQKLTINRVRKEPEKPKNQLAQPNASHNQHTDNKFRTVFIAQENTSYLKYAHLIL